MKQLTQRESEINLIAGQIELPGRKPAFLAELSTRAPDHALVSIILDLSCPPREMERQLDCLCKLIGRLPKGWRVLVYRLGCADALEEATLSDIVDSPIDFSSISEKHAANSRNRGSFIRPCVESIARQICQGDEKKALVFLVGDGHLADFGHVKLTKSVTVIGISNGTDHFSNYRRVFPNSMVYDYRDANLDESILDFVHPFHGLAKLRINGIALADGAVFWQHDRQRFEDWQSINAHEVNFAREDARILFDLPLIDLKNLEFDVESAFHDQRCTIKVENWSHAFPIEVQSSAKSIFVETESNTCLEVVFDVTPSDALFAEIKLSWDVAIALAERGATWFDGGILKAFNVQLCKNEKQDKHSIEYDSFICFCHSITNSTTPSRIIGIGLRRHSHPAAEFDKKSLEDFSIHDAFSIDYDEDSYRWILKLANGVRNELSHYASEKVDIKFSPPEGWTTIFSGDMKT